MSGMDAEDVVERNNTTSITGKVEHVGFKSDPYADESMGKEGMGGPMEYSVSTNVLKESYLAHVLSSSSDEVYDDPLTFLKYNSTFTSSTTVSGVPDVSQKNIQYNIQARGIDGNIERAIPGQLQLVNIMRVGAAQQSDIDYASTRNSALPRSFKTMSLLGVVERLAKGMAKYSLYGTLTALQLRGGGSLIIRSINAATDNIAVMPGSVFVTKRQGEMLVPGVETALANAISGEGGTMYTDLLPIDGAGVPQITTYGAQQLARGCYEAMCQIGRMYVQNSEGPSFALAVLRGINAVVTLAGHSDEGGYVRTVLRRGSYSTPYGAVLLNKDESYYTGIPSPGGGIGTFRRVVHSVLLASAGGVAACDPLTNIGNMMFPTIISLTTVSPEDPGVQDATPVTQAERTAMQSHWAKVMPEWAINYAYYLGNIFCAPGRTNNAIRDLCAMATDAIGCIDDHLNRRVAVAFYWVEPTTVVPYWDEMLPAFSADLGPLTITSMNRKVPMLRDYAIEDGMDTAGTSVIMRMAYMRRHGLFVHLTGHKDDGMAHIHLYSGTPSMFANVGGTGAMDARIMAGNSLDTYQWGRLHNQLIAPGEFINMNSSIRIMIRSTTIGDIDAPWARTVNHVPLSRDLDSAVCYACGCPSPQNVPNALVADNRTWSRSRSGAAQAIVLAKERGFAPDRAFGGQIRPTLGEPTLIGPGIGAYDPIRDIIVNAAPPLVNLDDTVGTEGAGESSNPRGAGTTARGVPVPLVIHNIADRGRRQPRGAVPTAGGAPPGSARAAGLPPPGPAPPVPPNPIAPRRLSF